MCMGIILDRRSAALCTLAGLSLEALLLRKHFGLVGAGNPKTQDQWERDRVVGNLLVLKGLPRADKRPDRI